MAQDEFTKKWAAHANNCAKNIINQLSKSKMMDVIGEMNDLYLFLAATKEAAPEDK